MNTKTIVITNYPPRSSVHGSHFGGVASFTKNTLNAITKASLKAGNKKPSFLVLADRFNGFKDYKEGNKHVIRCWKRNDYLLFIKLFYKILKYPKYKNVIIEFEFSLFGLKKIVVAMLPFFIFALRLMGKKVYFVSHHVLTNVNEVDGQLGIKKDTFFTKIYNLLLNTIYFLITLFSNKVIVFEQVLKDRLVKFGLFNKKVIVINHGVEIRKPKITKQNARKKLGLKENDFVVLNFGFIAWYKGSDLIARLFSKLIEKNLVSKNTKLLMVGGFSRNHKDNKVYKRMYSKVVNLSKKYSNQIIHTGFIPEEDIELYFMASDLVVFPYRTIIAASGPFSFVLTYKKPFIMSNKLLSYAKNLDFIDSLKECKLNLNDIIFKLNYLSLNKIIKRHKILKNNKLVEEFSSILCDKRSWDKIGDSYFSELYLPNLSKYKIKNNQIISVTN